MYLPKYVGFPLPLMISVHLCMLLMCNNPSLSTLDGTSQFMLCFFRTCTHQPGSCSLHRVELLLCGWTVFASCILVLSPSVSCLLIKVIVHKQFLYLNSDIVQHLPVSKPSSDFIYQCNRFYVGVQHFLSSDFILHLFHSNQTSFVIKI